MRVSATGTLPDEVYIVLDAGVEYNDETYNLYNYEILSKRYYTSIDEAKKVASDRLRATLADFDLSAFEDWNWQEAAHLFEYLAVHGVNNVWDLPDTSFNAFIFWCEDHNRDWRVVVPELVTIVAVVP